MVDTSSVLATHLTEIIRSHADELLTRQDVQKLLDRLAQQAPKPVLAAWLGGRAMREGLPILADAGVAAYPTPEQAIRCLAAADRYVNWRRQAGPPAAVPGPGQPAS